jgi:streptogramin lyase
MTAFDPPSGRLSGAYTVSVDKKNNLVWVSLHTVDKIARFDPRTGAWAEFPLPQAQSDVRRIEVDPSNPNRIWWSTAGGTTNGTTGGPNSGGSRLGFLEVLDTK